MVLQLSPVDNAGLCRRRLGDLSFFGDGLYVRRVLTVANGERERLRENQRRYHPAQ